MGDMFIIQKNKNCKNLKSTPYFCLQCAEGIFSHVTPGDPQAKIVWSPSEYEEATSFYKWSIQSSKSRISIITISMNWRCMCINKAHLSFQPMSYPIYMLILSIRPAPVYSNVWFCLSAASDAFESDERVVFLISVRVWTFPSGARVWQH